VKQALRCAAMPEPKIAHATVPDTLNVGFTVFISLAPTRFERLPTLHCRHPLRQGDGPASVRSRLTAVARFLQTDDCSVRYRSSDSCGTVWLVNLRNLPHSRCVC